MRALRSRPFAALFAAAALLAAAAPAHAAPGTEPMSHLGVGPGALAHTGHRQVAATQVMRLRGAVADARRTALRLGAAVDAHPRAGRGEWRTTSVAELRALDRLWDHRADRYRAERGPATGVAGAEQAVVEGFACIMRAESGGGTDAYRTNTGNGYYGAFQMDLGFQQTYGPEYLAAYGTADRWPAGAQLTAVLRAYYGYAGYAGRGFTPWPSTAAGCGLI